MKCIVCAYGIEGNIQVRTRIHWIQNGCFSKTTSHICMLFITSCFRADRANSWFFTADFMWDYFQISRKSPIVHKWCRKSAFTCPYGFHLFREMPFDVCNGPSMFHDWCRMSLHDFNGKYACCTSMTVLLVSPTFVEHVQRLDAVLNGLDIGGLRCLPTSASSFWKR